MTNINPNNDVGKINHSIKKEKKVKDKANLVAKTKSVEASSLDVLNSYGKANVTFRGKKSKNGNKIINVSDEEFNNVRVNANLPHDISLCIREFFDIYLDPECRFSNIRSCVTNFTEVECIQKKNLLYKILSNSELSQNKNVQQNIPKILDKEFFSQEADAKTELLDEYISTPELYNNETVQNVIGDVLYSVGHKQEKDNGIAFLKKYVTEPNLAKNEYLKKSLSEIVSCIGSENSLNCRLELVDTYLADPKLYNDKNAQKVLGDLLKETHSEVKLELAKKILSDSNLYNNSSIQSYVHDIFSQVYCQHALDIKTKVIDKILSDSNLYNNENIKNNLAYILYYPQKEEHADCTVAMMDLYASDSRLYNNTSFQKNIKNLLYQVVSKDDLEIKQKFINMYLSEPKLYESESLQENIGYMAYDIDSEEKLDVKMNLIDKYLSNPNLNEESNIKKMIGYIFYRVKKEDEIKLADKILSEPELYNNISIQKHIMGMFEKVDDKEIFESKMKILDRFLSSPKIYENEEIKNNLFEFIKLSEYIKKSDFAEELFDYVENGEMSGKSAILALDYIDEINSKDLKRLEKTISKELFNKLSLNSTDLVAAANLVELYKKNNINEIPLIEKREIVRKLVAKNKDLFGVSDTVKQNFPLIPKNAEEYCILLPALVKSLGIETNEISAIQEKEFDNATKVLSRSLSELSDEEFNNLSITQEYSKDEFIKDTLSIVKDIPKEERQKVYDYFGFELHHNRKAPTGFSIAGYPVNLNNGKKLAQIEDENTKKVVEQLRPYVIKFSENNKIFCENKAIETALNEIVKTLPELRTTIDREQYGMHEFDVLKHSLKLMQKVVQNPKFKTLSDSDKKIMMLSALLHDITKAEIKPDPMHNFESSFDAFYISKKFNLTQDEQIKLYKLINHHEWLKHLNNDTLSEKESTRRIESVAFDFQNDNLFELAKIFTEADIKAIMKDNTLYDRFSPALSKYSKLVEEKITELKKTQPLLPTTKLPKASDIKSRITTVNEDCSTNIKGVYLKDGLVVVKYNEVEDWEAIGLAKGSISRGIKTVSSVDNSEIDTGNIKFIGHGLDYPSQLSNFEAFSLPDSDALLSVSYMERPESKYRLFRTQGVLLDVDSKYIHGGGETDSGSGYSKNINEFKLNYAYQGSRRHDDRRFLSDLIKQTLHLTDTEYLEFINKNKNKSMLEIEPKEAREKLIKQFALINSNTRFGNRAYNEMYVSNPKVQGVFAYSPDDEVGEINNFIDIQHDFLKDYAKENDVPFVVFGD